jgi:hypothetical protein
VKLCEDVQMTMLEPFLDHWMEEEEEEELLAR